MCHEGGWKRTILLKKYVPPTPPKNVSLEWGCSGKGFLCSQPPSPRKNARDWCYTHGEFPPATTTRRIIVKFNLSWNSSSSSCFGSERENAMPAFVGILVKSGVQTHTHVSFPLLLWKKSNGKQKKCFVWTVTDTPTTTSWRNHSSSGYGTNAKKCRLHFQCLGETRFFFVCIPVKNWKTFILNYLDHFELFAGKEVKTVEMLGSIRTCKNPESVKDRKEVEERRKEGRLALQLGCGTHESRVVQFCFSNFLARRAHTLATPPWVAPSSEKPQFPRRKNNMRGSLPLPQRRRRSGIHINCPISSLFPLLFSAHGRSERVKVEFGNKDDAIYGKRHFISFWIPQSREFLRNMPYILWGNTFAFGEPPHFIGSESVFGSTLSAFSSY